MTKRVLFLLAIIPFLLIFPKQGTTENSYESIEVIPDDAIRLRILAHSNHPEDQRIKYVIRDRINYEITKWVAQMSNIADARTIIENRIPLIENIAKQTVEDLGMSYDVQAIYGENITFPRKLYGSLMYPEGDYEAVLITIGAGKGDNWWCVLFPPLCFLDFSSGTTVQAEDDKEIADDEKKEGLKIKFLLFEWLGWT